MPDSNDPGEASEPIKELLEKLEEEVKEEKIEKTVEQKVSKSPEEWFKAYKWSENPFILNILPELFVGYRRQTDDLVRVIQERHKVLMIVGPTGSGKTTVLKWLTESFNRDYEFIF